MDNLKGINLNFKYALKKYPSEGNLVYEYNPFYNYRLDDNYFLYNGKYYTQKELEEELTIVGNQWTDKLGNLVEVTPYQKGQLVDFITDELNFDLNNPINITPQWSYDNSVNLIINDGKNPPRLVNSRFSPTERNKYQVCNRKGNNDTNIYSRGDNFDIDTSLYKKIVSIPKLKFQGVHYGGDLKVGNYHFYFKYVDDDGNESDFFAESGLVSIFIGNTPNSIRGGFREENTHKLVKFFLSNTDAGYQNIIIYYSKSTSDIFQNATISYHRIETKYKINQSGNTPITITGFEKTTEVSETDINPTYQIYGSVETQDVAQNRLFLANVDRPKIPYEDLIDCALRFCPVIQPNEEYEGFTDDGQYKSSAKNTYYNSDFIYYKVGYWDDEIYRFGIVFILADNTLTPVFNVRGIEELEKDVDPYTPDVLNSTEGYPFYSDEGHTIRSFINYNEDDFLLVDSKVSNRFLENAKGVVSISHSNYKDIIGINFKVEDFVLDYLKNKLKIKGFFFVRQKRIPTTLCQAFTIGIDKESHTPVLPIKITDKQKDNKFITESFLAQGKEQTSSVRGASRNPKQYLVHDIDERLYELNDSEVFCGAAICPEYDVNSPYLNSLFTGESFTVRAYTNNGQLKKDTSYHYYTDDIYTQKNNNYQNVQVIGVEDNVKLVAINDTMYSARAGEAEEAFRYEYIGKENKTKECTNLLRGSYGPYIGLRGFDTYGTIIDVKIPNYSKSQLSDYFKIRYDDKSSFYAISDRFDLSEIEDFYDLDKKELIETLYRGDCYICQFTHRINRNFQDPSSPTNDKIVDKKCWAENFDVSDGIVKRENFDKINLGDVNAIKLGMWVTMFVRSTANLNIRCLDESIPDEMSMFGHARGFHPFYTMNSSGSYKIPDALCYNKGYEKSTSERYNFEVPDVPWIKNEFSNRIAYSDIEIVDSFKNGFRTFKGTNYRDYPKTYGSITRIIELHGNLLCVFEHGIGLIPVNERTVSGEGAGGKVYINTNNVLPMNPKILSGTFGSQWRESIIKTPRGIYGVDTVGKKIWRTNGEEIDFISDFKVQEFLNQNISLTERELLPIIGVRNVKTHYNKYKGDVMFTFYDNLYGFEERVWNLCYNENLQRWVTFYSWVPSYSENIYNQYFSFDRNTSKWITKLGVSKYGNDFSDGVTLDNVVIEDNNWSADLHLSNRNLPIGTGVKSTIEFELVRDNYKNHELFEIVSRKGEGNETIYSLKLKDGTTYDSLKSELYERNPDGSIKKDDERGIRLYLDRDKQINPDKIVRLLNIRAKIKVSYDNPNGDTALGEAYASGYNNKTFVDQGYYESVVAVIPKYNMQFLTTDFWKHGQAGIIDIADKIAPTYWYGKQHPFEFEFVVADNPQLHKIFDNLQIISNKAAPESFHYEIVGECYEFAKDKKNMYIRQEATKELYQFNGSDIVYNPDYKTIDSEPRQMSGLVTTKYDKSTIFPLYYRREDTINEIEDYYHLYGHKDIYGNSDKNFSALSGAEIVRYPNLGEYRIWNHAKAVDIHDFKKGGRMRGNMQYKEDKWDIQINPLNLVQRNEDQNEWTNIYGDKTKKMVPAECNLFAPPAEVYNKDENKGAVTLPSDWERNVISWGVSDKLNKEVKLKDKFIKIRVRYSGKDLAVISALKTLYSISYA